MIIKKSTLKMTKNIHSHINPITLALCKIWLFTSHRLRLHDQIKGIKERFNLTTKQAAAVALAYNLYLL